MGHGSALTSVENAIAARKSAVYREALKALGAKHYEDDERLESAGAASRMADRLWITCRHQDLVRNIVPCPVPSPTLWHRLGVPS